ncbi:helix-turn-helix domain-containing protein [Streptomyces sp. W16]|uniref:sigma-54-dependent Fis family transcriptional regulator n=1 Tax=Streptomyces sp. W16 TaxID=3076631 RepID=UPI00295B170E|nr:helix-turn-helix domain-containing protein [Streptomyces sp. W16]MDV9169699.1 helix-turn-helix domain-containing protein [Streptomyces sp. W16]
MVRTEIVESWRRSRLNGVDPDHVPCVEGEPSLDSRTAKVAIPVLTSMADVLIGANTSLLLSAPDGTLLWRWDEDSRLRSRLNRSSVVIGTRWSEDVIGTNGLGTALETARAVTVNGTEHFNEALHDFACAGAPIRHPVTHRVTGVLSVTSLVEHASPLMAPTLLRLAHDIEEELYGETSMHERQMLRHFLAERRRTRSAVVVVSADVVIANSLATSMDLDHSALWQRIEDGPDDVIGLELSSGSRVTVCRPVHRGGVLVGAVVVAEEMPASAVVRPTPTRARDPRRQERPWIRVVAQLRSTASTTDRLLVVGEHGTGKRAALRAAVADSDRAYRELDCATVDEVGHEQWLADARALVEHVDELLVFAHLDDLDDRTYRALATILDRAPRIDGSDLRLAATVSAAAFHNDLLPRAILDQFPPLTFEIPPLRKRTDDALARLVDQGVGMPRLSHEVIQAVQRHPWPGNHRQLEEFRRWLTRQNRPVVTAADLPPAWLHEVTRGHLTAMQTAESDAIATALREHGGNKAAAATALGISRSSLYRKLREYRLR